MPCHTQIRPADELEIGRDEENLAGTNTEIAYRYDSYVTEKLVDCLLTATVPIYWGPVRDLPAGLDPAGIIFIQDFDHAIAGESLPLSYT